MDRWHALPGSGARNDQCCKETDGGGGEQGVHGVSFGWRVLTGHLAELGNSSRFVEPDQVGRCQPPESLPDSASLIGRLPAAVCGPANRPVFSLIARWAHGVNTLCEATSSSRAQAGRSMNGVVDAPPHPTFHHPMSSISSVESAPTSFGVFKAVGWLMIGLPTQAEADTVVTRFTAQAGRARTCCTSRRVTPWRNLRPWSMTPGAWRALATRSRCFAAVSPWQRKATG